MAFSPVLQAALDAFAEHGYEGASVRDVATRSGISVGGLYYHYRSKQEMLVDLLQGSVEDVYARACVAIVEAGPDPGARLNILVECLCLYMTHRREVAVIGAEIRSLNDENRNRFIAIRDAFEALFQEAVREGAASGDFSTREPDQAARAIITMCRGIAFWYRPDGEDSPEQITQTYQRFASGIVNSGA